MKAAKSRQVILLALSFLSINVVSHAGGTDFLIMPKQLGMEARKFGCEQINDFYSIASVYGPPFVYGVVKSDDLSRYYGLNSAAFWCRKRGTTNQYLLIAIADKELKDLFKCPNLVVEVRDYIGALSLKDDVWNLGGFRDTRTGAPLAQKLRRATAILSTAEAYEDVFMCQDGRWVRKERD